ncbi:MAG: hypothetical protein Athens101410_388 [Parcubacteria group bacterium Athens1014_10]|nr:MAG: hypothetical protein Athens101410_388 [Parcubacteria group bacterium Athens1014_10]TSD05467.1 MAG: hypothetical protein Athens071412_277 [Parcubacteria group bacterium Athens0714_12]
MKLMRRNKFITIILLFALIGQLITVNFAFAAETTGTIDANYKYAWGENIGWLNFGSSEGNVQVTDTGLSGYVWAENAGWIDLSPVYGGVSNDVNGNLTGYGWGENTGWINFNPTYGGVTIDSVGNFNGYAWGENIGWIVFNCLKTGSCVDVDYKVKTNWVTLTCGNGLLETGEQCDGSLLGGATCLSRGFTAGTLGCSSNCTFNTSACMTAGGGPGLPPPPQVVSGEQATERKPASLLIDKGALYTYSRRVVLSLSAENASQMAVSNKESFEGISWENYQENRIWYLEIGDGVKNVYAKFRSPGGVASQVISDSIILDTLSPDGLIIVYPADGEQILEKTPIISGTAEPDSKIFISLDDFVFYQTLTDLQGKWSYKIITPLKLGKHKLIIKSQDAAGNFSPEEIIYFEIIEKEITTTPEIPAVLPIKWEEIERPVKEWEKIIPKEPPGEIIPEKITPIEEIISKEGLPIIEKPIMESPIKEKISIRQEIKKNWQAIGQNLKDSYQEIKELAFSDFEDVIKNPFLEIKEAGKDLGKSGVIIVRGIFQSSFRIIKGTGQNIQSFSLKIVRGIATAVKNTAIALNKTGKKIFLVLKPEVKTREKKQPPSPPTEVQPIEPPIIVKESSLAPEQILEEKPLFVSSFGNIKIKSAGKEQAVLIAGSNFKSFIKPIKPAKEIKGKLIFIKSLSARANNNVIASEAASRQLSAAIPMGMQQTTGLLRRSFRFASVAPRNDNVSKSLRSLLAMTLSIPFAQAQEVAGIFDAVFDAAQAKEWLIGEFIYSDPDKDGIYEAEIQLPPVAGQFSLATVINYADGEDKIIETEILIDPEGYVFSEEVKDKETRIPQAEITIYFFNPQTEKFEIWQAGKYDQKNPQITDKTGQYSFLTPQGKYYLEAKAKGYKIYKSEEFFVAEGQPVHQNIKLIPLGFFEKIWEE